MIGDMIGDIILAVFAILLTLFYANVWWAFRKITKELDALSTKYAITNESIRDLKTRIKFLEMFSENEKARSALPEVKGFSYKI